MDEAALLSGKHALITGGSLGIGAAIARRFVQAGAELTLLARREEPLARLRAELVATRPGARVEVLALDISSESRVAAELGAVSRARPVDLLINNAAIARPGRFLEMDPSEFRAQMEVNYFGTLAVCRAVLPRMQERRSGYVVNVGSLSSVIGVYGYSAYSATKFALLGFSECLRAELRPHGIRTSVLLPPDTDTPMHHGEQSFMPEETRAIIGTLRLLSADDVARALVRGMRREQFLIIPGLDARLSAIAARVVPGVVRAYLDWRVTRSDASRRLRTARPASPCSGETSARTADGAAGEARESPG